MDSLSVERTSRAQPPEARPFVARAAELTTFERDLGAALGGMPRVLLLSGDAGIGKTRLLRCLQRRAADRGFEVVTGRCLEHLDLPYHPFESTLFPRLVEAVRTDESLGDVADAIISALDRSPRETTPSTDSPAREQLWFFRAIAKVLLAIARHRPLLVTVDDLQWADRPSGDLFVHLGQEIADAALRAQVPIVLAATHRADPETPLGRDLSRLGREEIVRPVPVAALTEHETGELVRSLGLARPSRQLIDLVLRTTGGNPLLVEAVVAHLSRGGVREEGGQLVAAGSLVDVPLPQDLSAAAAARLDPLDDTARLVLSTAAIVGEPFAMDVVAAICEHDVAEVERVVRDAEDARVVARDPEGYRFAHPAFTRALLGALTSTERQHLHLTAARTLVAERGATPDRTLAVAFHYAQAGASADPEDVVRACTAGGNLAWQLAAWGEAARDFDAAANVMERLGSEPAATAEAWQRAGDAHCRNMDPGPGRERFGRAAVGFRAVGDVRGEARALAGLVHAEVSWGTFGQRIDLEPLAALVPELEQVDPMLGARVLAQLAEASWPQGRTVDAEGYAARALALVADHPDPEAETRAHMARAQAHWLDLDLHGALVCLRDALQAGRRSGDPWLANLPLPRLALTLLWLGELDEADANARAASQRAEETHDWGEQSLALAAQIGVALARGDFPEAEAYGEAAWAAIRLSGYTWSASLLFPGLAWARLLQCDRLGARSALDRWAATMSELDHALGRDTMSLIDLAVDAGDGAVDGVPDALAERRLSLVGAWPVALGTVQRAAALLEIASVAELPLPIDALAHGLDEVASRGMVFTEGIIALVPRLRADAAALAGNFDEAEARYDEAIATARAIGARPELARAQLGAARLLVERDTDRSAEHAAAAARTFAALSMPSLEAAALVLASSSGIEIPPAPATPPPPAVLRERTMAILLFTDVVDSTKLTEQLGDLAYLQTQQALDSRVRTAIEQIGGMTVEGIRPGDGLLAVFTSVREAVDAAQAAHDHASSVGLQLHIGIHAGDVIRSGTGVHGGAVNLAARACAEAPPGQTLVSEVIRTLGATSAGVRFEDRGLFQLKGISEPQRLFAVGPPTGAADREPHPPHDS